jgi:hypothetical protein
MGARVFVSARPMALVVLLIGALLASSERPVQPGVPSAPPIASVTGAGWGDRAMCIGCAVGLFGAGGATLGGALIGAALYPEAYAACGFICIKAF